MSSDSKLGIGQWVRRIIPPEEKTGYAHDGAIAVVVGYPRMGSIELSVEIRLATGVLHDSFVRFLHPMLPEEAALFILGK